MLNDYRDKAVLITGGTMGIGLATGLAFGRAGAHCYLTCFWGSADEGAVRARFAEAGAPEPTVVTADASAEEDTEALMRAIAERHPDGVEAFVSNVCVVPRSEGLQRLQRRALFKSIEYCTWPMVAYLEQIKQAFGRYPRYAVAMSTDGMDHFYEGYEYVAVSKAVLEVLCRYLAKYLGPEGVRINAVRTRNVITDSALAIHGADYPEFVRRFASARHFLQPAEVGDAVLALCSGMLDAMSGQVLSVDRGGPFSDTLMRVYKHREEYGL